MTEIDTLTRLKICEFVNDMAERALAVNVLMITEPSDLIDAAEMIEHYVTNGGTVSFDCSDSLRKTVGGE